MKLTKSQRELVRLKYKGRCAYCGELLGPRWHADHILPIERKLKYVPGEDLKQTGECYYPERHQIDNIMPACVPCNLYKCTWTLEDFRRHLQDSVNVLTRNLPTYRHAKRFGLVKEIAEPVVFYFERVAMAPELPTNPMFSGGHGRFNHLPGEGLKA